MQLPMMVLRHVVTLGLFCLVLFCESAFARVVPVGTDTPEARASPVNYTQIYTDLRPHVLSRYFTNEEMVSFMLGFGQVCRDVVSVFSIGQTVNQRPVLAMDISQTSGIRDDKPYFQYLGNMHGDEPSGRQLLLALAVHMCEQQDAPKVQQLLEAVHIVAVPSINPDGFEVKKRYNARGVDLNRNFPDRVRQGNTNLTATGKEEPEVVNVMRLTTSLPFAAGANMHEGALVANYPWDADTAKPGEYAPSPDDANYIFLAKSYARLHKRMSTQATSKYQPIQQKEVFPDGITNGNHWYPVFGGMQDWLYLMGGCMELTLELWESKWPRGHLLQSIWDENEDALLGYPLLALLGGVYGVVTGPVGAATIQVDDFWRVTTDPVTGGYSRPLAPGTYTMTVSAAGYQQVTRRIMIPVDGSGTQMDVSLVPIVASNGGAADAAARPAPPRVNTTFPYVILAGRNGTASLSNATDLAGATVPIDEADRKLDTSGRGSMIDVQREGGSGEHDSTSANGRADIGKEGLTGGTAFVGEQMHQAVHAPWWSFIRSTLVILAPVIVVWEVVKARAKAKGSSRKLLGSFGQGHTRKDSSADLSNAV